MKEPEIAQPSNLPGHRVGPNDRFGGGLTIGIALGLLWGTALGNPPVGLLIGVALGVGLGEAMRRTGTWRHSAKRRGAANGNG